MSVLDSDARSDRHDDERNLLDAQSHYDFVLAVIPTAFLLSMLVGHLLAISTRTSLVTAGFVGALAMIDALFFNPPNRPGGS